VKALYIYSNPLLKEEWIRLDKIKYSPAPKQLKQQWPTGADPGVMIFSLFLYALAKRSIRIKTTALPLVRYNIGAQYRDGLDGYRVLDMFTAAVRRTSKYSYFYNSKNKR